MLFLKQGRAIQNQEKLSKLGLQNICIVDIFGFSGVCGSYGMKVNGKSLKSMRMIN